MGSVEGCPWVGEKRMVFAAAAAAAAADAVAAGEVGPTG
jgi:hypothetical protein